ncbi:multicopper oxidase domain-containing protein [Sideroxydans lithotrophicus]|uniref:Multicopper oxidase type 3 n=1 Tax=Sideroxydans lithotrophicus (strain ES-1) TaxID=580332 RepID=D5CSW0_SIDLE|nr:multicopper oxidase domain-containing protein [Sideroxydans lithotrophicus]ADE12046.1 multicopper oxidase type 3 [Sideroxydans lithotrophicus ES-1]
MNPMTRNFRRLASWFFASAAATCLLFAATAQAEVNGITGPVFNLTASADYISQPDGAMIYSWGYGCTTTPSGFAARPATGVAGPAPNCPLMQLPGPTMIVTEGQAVTINLTNSLPLAAGNTSIVFPGFQVTASGGVGGAMVQEAAPGSTVSYTFTPTHPGTYSYYSGTQPELQIQMGLYGAIVVLPTMAAPTGCTQGPFSLAATAYDHAATCYDREYLFEFSEIDSRMHQQALDQVNSCAASVAGGATSCPEIMVTTEPYRPNYFLINGRSMPDDMDASYSASYIHQPYNGNPHIHPGERLLMRVVGQGRWQHPFHFHGNHARVLARDGNLIVSQSDATKLAGPLLFTIPTVSGQTVDAIFTWTGKGLNWDVYNHHSGDQWVDAGGVSHPIVCNPDAYGYNTVGVSNDPTATNFAPNYGEWCADHNKPIPITPPDPQIVANGQWYAGTPYLGIQSSNSGFNSTPLPPGTLNFNGPTSEAGYAYMWHSHNEREITTNDVFPGGMMMMLIVDPFTWYIDESL